MAHRRLSDDVVSQAIDLRVGARDVDVPGPVVVADLLFHSIRKGGEDAAAQNEWLFVDRTGFDTADVVVVPVDVALDRPVPTKDEAVALGSAIVLVAATPDVSPLVVVLYEYVAIVLGADIQLPLVPRKPVDLQLLGLQRRTHFK